MSEPCSKEQVLTTLQVKQAEIQGQIEAVGKDVTHVKGRIDNGMSHTIKDIHTKLTELQPVIQHHANIVRRVEDLGWLVSRWVVTAVVTVLVGLVLWAITKGFLTNGLLKL
jgi:hypothetical protein